MRTYPGNRSNLAAGSLALLALLALLTLLASLLIPTPVQAGGGQPLLPGGSSLQPVEDTSIQLAAEVVTMDIRQATEADNALVKLTPQAYVIQLAQPVWFPAIAEVQADFTLRNPTGAAVDTIVQFPLASALETADWGLVTRNTIIPSLEDFQVRVNGEQQDFTVTLLPFENAQAPLLPRARFLVHFPGGQDTLIQLSYKFALQPSISGNEMALYYVFHSGAGWDGPIGRTELTLNLPYPASLDTLAGMPAGSLVLPPYFWPSQRADLPGGAVLQGSQVRWIWDAREPGPADDLTIWLLRLDKWNALQSARRAVEISAQDGPAWLDLATTYYSMSWLSFDRLPTIFASSYLSPALQAYKQAAALLPESPAPPAGKGLCVLAPYMAGTDAPPQVLAYVQDELSIALQLEASHPDWTKTAGSSVKLLAKLKSARNLYQSNSATATVSAPAVLQPSASPSATPSPTPAATVIPVPSATRQPSPTMTPARPAPSTRGKASMLLVAAAALVLVAVGFLALRRALRSD
jgi:hypothetical protein